MSKTARDERRNSFKNNTNFKKFNKIRIFVKGLPLRSRQRPTQMSQGAFQKERKHMDA
jgi:hypothetical protein